MNKEEIESKYEDDEMPTAAQIQDLESVSQDLVSLNQDSAVNS